MDGGVLQPDVFQFRLVAKEEPVSDTNLEFTGIQKGVIFLVFHQHTLQVHLVKIEKVDPDVLDVHLCLEFPGKFFCDLVGKPVLAPFRLEEAPGEQQKDKDPKQDTSRYLPEFPQGESFL